ncbi:cell wall metabolism sensor histidine kinase WalK [Paenibacillus sp. P46E]|uniref:sensor histidine kinase n=1 Tax=Paenibacillus sp. P46E TaxID=1349436 RepID=UPI000938D718|nr:HAMP domain-containing sensor histidine kinase [Paenibacillus sp. P46E]OKP97179.1 two-component sensor histidine kinase [Paenibacillus sp. P46E]
MKNKSITFKLFMITVLFFAFFYMMIILSQLLLFNDFYENHKLNKVEQHLAKFASDYTRKDWSSDQLTREIVKFMTRNRSQLAIIDIDGKVVVDDPYHMLITQDDGQKMMVSLSLFMTLYGDQFRAANIQKGDRITLWGEVEKRGKENTSVLYPEKMYIPHSKVIGEYEGEVSSEVSGTVSNIELPYFKIWNQRQGLLMQALSETFPLSGELKNRLNHMEMQQFPWFESWSGTNNVIILQPLLKNNGELEILFSVTSIQEISDTNDALREFYIYLGIGGFLLILILSLFFSKIVTKPLIALNQMAKRMLNFDFTAVSPIRQNDELGSLSNSMLLMSQKLDSALSELKDANVKLLEDIEQKQRLEVLQQSFFANASHELKTPLSIVKSFAEGLQDGVNVNKREHYMSVIIEEAGKMEMLIKDMLDLARLESGTIVLRKRMFLLSELVEKVADKLVYLLKEKELEIIVVPVNELHVLADLEWMEQVIINLIMNAIRHAEEGSVITIKIHSDTSTKLYVDNIGETIPEDQLNLIWERFYRGEPSRSRKTGGTGLGLSIAGQILGMHGFGYRVENLQNGVRFIIHFSN